MQTHLIITEYREVFSPQEQQHRLKQCAIFSTLTTVCQLLDCRQAGPVSQATIKPLFLEPHALTSKAELTKLTHRPVCQIKINTFSTKPLQEMLLLNKDFDLKFICEPGNKWTVVFLGTQGTVVKPIWDQQMSIDHRLLSVLILNCNPSAIGALNFVTMFSKSLNKMSYVEMLQKQKGSWRKLF